MLTVSMLLKLHSFHLTENKLKGMSKKFCMISISVISFLLWIIRMIKIKSFFYSFESFTQHFSLWKMKNNKPF